MNPLRDRDAALDDRARLECSALALAFEANAVAELGHSDGARAENVLAAARRLERDIAAIAPALDPGDRVVEFARLVARLIPEELNVRTGRDVA
jgi:hypothetical protein